MILAIDVWKWWSIFSRSDCYKPWYSSQRPMTSNCLTLKKIIFVSFSSYLLTMIMLVSKSIAEIPINLWTLQKRMNTCINRLSSLINWYKLCRGRRQRDRENGAGCRVMKTMLGLKAAGWIVHNVNVDRERLPWWGPAITLWQIRCVWAEIDMPRSK